ncbi:30S ribosomal protein S17 [bacterium HR24]|jgi:small subunit ribosomal protein S17|nr:30S ribosomal protein S17 [bacterium HR24]
MVSDTVNYGRRKVMEGVVVSDRMQKTVVVAVERVTRHPLYKKTIRRTKKYHAHDENNECRVGDRVLIVESRPLSRTKRWRVARILQRAEQVEVRAEEVDLETLGERRRQQEEEREGPAPEPSQEAPQP